MARILVVEDEPDLNDLVTLLLRQEGHEVFQAVDGEQGLNAVEAVQPDLIILDWMLPKLDGLVVCRRIREHHITPIIMLTAKGEEADMILGLEVGADDYVTKPFRNRELLARVRSILRRQDLNREAVSVQASIDELPEEVGDLTAGPIRINADQRAAYLHDDEIELTPKEFDLLILFVQNPGRAFSRDYLLERVWGDDVFVTDRTVDTHVQRLRKKLGDESDMIRTVWGVGYKLQRDS
jgi:DNA-binding response OmpR family regulator